RHIFLSHGHFDHVVDVPAILKRNAGVTVYGSETAVATVLRESGETRRVHHVQRGRIQIAEKIHVDVLPSRHVHFDMPLIWDTARRALRSPARKKYLRPSVLTKYPCG